MTFQEWQSNPKLATELEVLLNNPVFKMAELVLDGLSPSKQSINPSNDPLIATAPHLILGEIRGFEKYSKMLRELTKPVVSPKQPKEDYRSKESPTE